MSGLASNLDTVSEGGNDPASVWSQSATWFMRLAPWLLIAGLLLFHAINNWIWLTENVTLTGWDRPRHLAHSLNYARMLSPLSIQSLFDVMVSDPVRPPLFPASATPMYRLFGWTSDIATMVNVVYMAILLVATFGIGKRWGGRGLGMVSVVLLALFPMFYAMSRHFYLEFALTAMVALSVWLLLATDGFQRRGASLFFGLSLGLGLLTKRTFAVFAIGPVIVAILAAGLLPALWQRLKQRPRIYWKRLLLALLGGLVLAAIWYLPNREAVQNLILGDALSLFWWALAALTIYFVMLPSAPLSNSLASLSLAAALASTWYLARVEFVQRMALYGYGVNDPRGRTLQLDRLDTYLFYLRRLANEHMSFLLFGVFLLVLVLAMAVYLRRQGSLGQVLRAIRLEGWVVVAWAGGAYLLLTFSIYQETRAFLPVLPAIALIFGAALLKLPWRGFKWALFALVVVFGLLQFLALSYEPVSKTMRVSEHLGVTLPGWGATTLFAQGGYLELPDEGQTDRDYWIQPDILQRMEVHRQEEGRELLSLGLLARTRQVNAGAFIYLILAEYPHLRVEGMLDRYEETLPYERLFAHDYVAVKRVNAGMNPGQEEVIEAILDASGTDDFALGAPTRLFSEAFDLEATYLLPDGDTVYLYRQLYGLPEDYPVEYVTKLAGDLTGRTRPGDAILLYPSDLAAPFVSNYDGPAEIYLAPASEEELAAIVAGDERLFVVLGDAEAFAAAGSEGVRDRALDWLSGHAFQAGHEWADSLQVVTYGATMARPAVAPAVEVGALLGDQVVLVGFDLQGSNWQPGDIVPLTLFWRGTETLGMDYDVFVHLVNGDGELGAQSDSAPVGGSRPTSSWPAGEVIVDRRGMLLPDSLPAGEYELRVGMYSAAAGERLPVRDAGGQLLGDGVSLGVIVVVSP